MVFGSSILSPPNHLEAGVLELTPNRLGSPIHGGRKVNIPRALATIAIAVGMQHGRLGSTTALRIPLGGMSKGEPRKKRAWWPTLQFSDQAQAFGYPILRARLFCAKGGNAILSCSPQIADTASSWPRITLKSAILETDGRKGPNPNDSGLFLLHQSSHFGKTGSARSICNSYNGQEIAVSHVLRTSHGAHIP